MRMRRCLRKRRYRDEATALHELEVVQAKRAAEHPDGDRPRECRAYFCGECSGWHLTSQPNQKAAAA